VSDAGGIVVVGAGAAGLMAAIWAARSGAGRVTAVDGARRLGAKILVAGGGRCNVTHYRVDESAYAGSSRSAIRHVLRGFDVERTRAFFAELGVELKREETGKLFPVSDDAHSVLNALLGECRRLGVRLRHPWRVSAVRRCEEGFEIEGHEPTGEAGGAGGVSGGGEAAAGAGEVMRASRVILATGGRALPRSGSDGAGYGLARGLGHTVTERVFPALVPLVLAEGHWVRSLSGLTVPATLELRSGTGKRLVSFTNSTLCTHFGLSGPSVLDISRYYTQERFADAGVGGAGGAGLVVNWLPGRTGEQVDACLLAQRSRSPARVLSEEPWPAPAGPLPDRLARALCAASGVDASSPMDRLSKDARRALVQMVTATPLPVTGDRGFTHAEVTAGGVPLGELQTATMASRVCPGLHIIGELCDVDGRIGGFNFQWAWASGYLAGRAAAAALAEGEQADPAQPS
jgi:predicted flavoprotein YhiN